MNIFKQKMSTFLILSLLTTIPIGSSIAGISASGKSINSLSISSNRTENNYHYFIEIHIEGIETSSVSFETDYQTLYLLAQKGGNVSDVAIAGAQVIRLAFDFAANANLKKYFRVNKKNKIIISVPKS